jgi:hypothetical protein
MNIGEVLNGVYDDEIGWRPASGSIKPVHVANGLVRALSARNYDLQRLHETVVWWKRGKIPDEDRSYDALLAIDDDGVVESLADGAADFDRVRRFLAGLLGADQAVFPSVAQSDFTVTASQMTSRSGNDRGLGEFGAALLLGGENSSRLAEIVRRAVDAETPSDPITAAVWPLLSPQWTPVDRPNKAEKPLRRGHNKEFVSRVRAAAADLATHEEAQGNRLRSLERSVHFVSVATLVHAQWLGAAGTSGSRVPIVLASNGLAQDELTVAGELSLRKVYENFEEALAEFLSERIAKGKALSRDGLRIEPVSSDGREMRPVLRSIGSAGSGHAEPDDDTISARMADFTEAKRAFGSDDPSRVLGHALVASYLREYVSGGPREFLRGLLTRTGFIYPHFQGRGLRRVRPNTRVMDMIVRSCVPSGLAIPLDEFLERLWDRFGIIVGGRRNASWDDADALSDVGIDVDIQALQKNTDSFVDELEAIGLAVRHADHVTFVGDINGF